MLAIEATPILAAGRPGYGFVGMDSDRGSVWDASGSAYGTSLLLAPQDLKPFPYNSRRRLPGGTEREEAGWDGKVPGWEE